MSADILVYFWLVIENRINALFAGQTASGKTTVLNAFSFFIPRNKKVVSIEETREINLSNPNWIPCVSRCGSGESTNWELIGAIDIYDLLKAALRQRPEYLIVGEVRGEEAYALFQAMRTGHATYSTIHADSTKKLISRLVFEPINIPYNMLPVLDVVSFHVNIVVNGKRVRRCKKVIEITGIDPESKELSINEVFHWDRYSDKFIYSGKSYILDRICHERNMTGEEMHDEMNRRKELLRWMDINNIRDFQDVSMMISKYNNNPDKALQSIKKILGKKIF
jgi:flagellar protein FlaI